MKRYLILLAMAVLCFGQRSGSATKPVLAKPQATKATKSFDSTAAALAEIAQRAVRKHDWPEWGGSGGKNNTPYGKDIPKVWNIKNGLNIKWQARLGSLTFSSPVVANGRIFIGTSNGAGNIIRLPANIDIGCLVCFDEKTGELLWQHSNSVLKAGRVNNSPAAVVCSTPYVDGERLWFVSNRSEVVCLDTEGFHDGENDGPFKTEPNENLDESDVVWKFDMVGRLGTFPHNLSNCSVTCVGDILLVNSSNGVDATHTNIPAPNAPSFFALDRRNGQLIWTDNSPGANILHGQWSNPSVVVVNGKPQVLFGGGDGWLRSFHPEGNGKGGSKLLWKFDCNPKDSVWRLGGTGTRNNIVATPVVYDGLIYLAVGQDPENGEGMGHLYCIKPPDCSDGRDVSRELAVDANNKMLPHRRIRAIDPKRGEKAIPNPRSAMVWHYGSWTLKEYDQKPFEQQFHRSCSNATIKNGLLVIADFSGLVHCLDAKSGKAHWTYDMSAECWSTPLIVEDRIYVGDSEGDVAIFPLTDNPKRALRIVNGKPFPALGEVKMKTSIYSTPVVGNNVLIIATKNTLFAISANGK